MALATLFSAGVVIAGDEGKAKSGKEMGKDQPEEHKAKMSRHDYQPEFRRITEVKDAKVTTEKGETFGTIEDIVIDVDHGRAAYAVISHGGVLGIGDKDVLLPFAALRFKGDKSSEFTTKATVEQLEQAEAFDDDNPELVRKLNDAAFAERLHRQFAVRPYWEQKAESPGMKAEKTSEKASGERLSEKARTSGPGDTVLATTLLTGGGVDIRTNDGVDAGDLNDLMVDVRRGHIGYAIVERESEIVSENRLCAVPWELIRLRRAEPRSDLALELPLQKLKDAPGFQASQWPDMAKTDWNERIHTYYDSTPYYVIYGYVGADEGAELSFAQSKIKSCTGTIQGIDRSAEGLAERAGEKTTTLRITLKDEKVMSDDQKSGDTVTVELAPSSFLISKGLELREGQEVIVKGWKATGTDTMRVVAMSVEAGGTSVKLRDHSGQPQW